MRMQETSSRRTRRAVTLVELIVACTLLTSFMTVIIPMTIRLVRVRQTMQEAYLAQQELANQMDILTTLSLDSLIATADHVSLGPDAARQLADAQLTVNVTRESSDPADTGYRVQIELTWTNVLGNQMAPRRLTSWVYPPGSGRTVTPSADEASP